MFDSHCHPTDVDDPVLVVRSAIEVGLHSLLACGYNHQSNQDVIALRQRLPLLPISIGIHPWFADEPTEQLEALIAAQDPIAVGECGLDAKPDDSIPSDTVQRKAFELQLDIALRRRLPLTVHSRRAAAQAYELISAFTGVRGVMHAFGGSYEQAKLFVDRGWLIGIGGAVTRPNARRVHQLGRRLPIDGLALETDAPAIGLEGVNVPDVRPAHLPRIAGALATLRGIDVQELIRATDINVERIFGPRTCQAIQRD